jgi:molecular chaperone GrpE
VEKEEIKEEVENTEKCKCNDNCTCGDDCNCTPDNKCSEECTCGNDCNCGDNCECGDDCECKKEKKDKKKDKKKLFGNKKDDKIKEYEKLIKELEDKILVMSADNVNYRKRKDEEVSRLLKFCNEDIIKDLLSISDNFERALKIAEDKTDEEFVKFNEGYKMIYCSIQNILEKYDVKAIDGANKPFDPVYHNAVIMEAKEGVESGYVIEVLQKGYLYKDKVIRPAMVKVSE